MAAHRRVNDDDNRISGRDARAHFAAVISRAQDGSPAVITRSGKPVAAVVPVADYNALEDANDRCFAHDADRDLAENPE